jgi:YYY domain-containing protein
MIDFLLWYVLLTFVGLLALPVAYKMLPKLADRGYALARPLGLLLWGFAFWLLASLQILQNNIGGVLFALLLLLVLSIFLVSKQWEEMKSFYQARLRTVIIAELVFLTAFAFWALIRSISPEITGTEKPMELMFINSILRSPSFPPQDLWLSGYAISYYYFGYVIVAMLVRMTGVYSGVGFNLAVAAWFALTAISAYGVVLTLVSRFKSKKDIEMQTKSNPETPHANLLGLLGPFYILIVSNLEGFFELLHARGIFWSTGVNGILQSSFWKWLAIKELENPPALPFSWTIQRFGGIWWWRASRVLQDYDVLKGWREIIDEFPFFSYYLADLHPHVLAMPFVLLVIGLALNLFLSEGLPLGNSSLFSAVGKLFYWKKTRLLDIHTFLWVRKAEFWLAALALGALAFFNTWDFPIYVGLFCGAFVLNKYRQDGWSGRLIGIFIELGLVLGVTGVLLYLPFYLGFSSQAGGILPSLDFFTRGKYFWVMFASLLFPVITWLIWEWRKSGIRPALMMGLKITGFFIGGLWILSYLLGWMILEMPRIAASFSKSPELSTKLMEWESLFSGLHGGASTSTLLLGSLRDRFLNPFTWLTLLALFALAFGLIGILTRPKVVQDGLSTPAQKPQPDSLPDKEIKPHGFVLLLVLLGCLLTIFPEFFYLRDQFGWRMNTIFKFYFQVWILWGLAAAFSTAVFKDYLREKRMIPIVLLLVGMILMALVYPVFGIKEKIRTIFPNNQFALKSLTLDGTAHINQYRPDEMQAIQWLSKAPLGVIVEAVGGSYSGYARISTHSGQACILGWPGHESQWRGGAREIGSRETDVKLIYESSNWQNTLDILHVYQVRYIYIGDLERSTYRVNESKFQKHLGVVFQTESAVIYQVTGQLGEER